MEDEFGSFGDDFQGGFDEGGFEDYDGFDDAFDRDCGGFSHNAAADAAKPKEEAPPKKAVESALAAKPELKDKKIPSHVADRWNKLLFSEKYSDVKFVFPDGSILHAHKNILAMASPYFDTCFAGPWEENHSGGMWQTTNSMPAMKAILSFIYTGDLVPLKALNLKNLIETISLSKEYQMPILSDLAERHLKDTAKDSLSISSLKDILCSSHLHNLPSVKALCFDFIHEDWSHRLFSITSIEQEDQDLWKEVVSALQERELTSKGGKKAPQTNTKRPRT